MTRQFLNTLYVQTTGAYLSLDHETLRVTVDGVKLLHVPLLHLDGIVLFGPSGVSPGVLQRCAAEGKEITFLDYHGRFTCRMVGPTHGNILLRTAQYDTQRRPPVCLEIARRLVAGKIHNSRTVLMRGARDTAVDARRLRLRAVIDTLAASVRAVPDAPTLDALRGVEGDAAACYFSVFGELITSPSEDFAFRLRSRRPPRDRVNALISFLYALLAHDCVSALESVGLDPQCGYLHALRPGRPALALDLMEEFRAPLADRLALTLINRRQLAPRDFDVREDAGGSVLLNETGRKTVIGAYQQRKDELTYHAVLEKDLPYGLLPHLQARLFARHLRGDLASYTPFLCR
jgi:CRISPR-associated protein Cas1